MKEILTKNFIKQAQQVDNPELGRLLDEEDQSSFGFLDTAKRSRDTEVRVPRGKPSYYEKPEQPGRTIIRTKMKRNDDLRPTRDTGFDEFSPEGIRAKEETENLNSTINNYNFDQYLKQDAEAIIRGDAGLKRRSPDEQRSFDKAKKNLDSLFAKSQSKKMLNSAKKK